MYDLDDIRERVREYLVVRHPGLIIDDDHLTVIRDTRYDEGQDWMFLIQYRNKAMPKKHLLAEFDRYTLDFPKGTMEAREGLGGDYITVRSGLPLLIGDGDDGGAVEAVDGLATIWLRAI